jgi:RES domain-containing protein
MIVFRIVLKKFGPTARDAFNGHSGYATDGRWHSSGRYLDYAAESRSMATLERLVHYKRFDHLAPHVIYTVDIPNAQIDTVLKLPKGWDGEDLLAAAQAQGNNWCDKGKSPALQVPSAVTPGEHNVMINSRHPEWDWRWVKSAAVSFEFDSRLGQLTKRLGG